jgi:hypothetical protein
VIIIPVVCPSEEGKVGVCVLHESSRGPGFVSFRFWDGGEGDVTAICQRSVSTGFDASAKSDACKLAMFVLVLTKEYGLLAGLDLNPSVPAPVHCTAL